MLEGLEKREPLYSFGVLQIDTGTVENSMEYHFKFNIRITMLKKKSYLLVNSQNGMKLVT